MDRSEFGIRLQGRELRFNDDQSPIEMGVQYNRGAVKVRVTKNPTESGFLVAMADEEGRLIKTHHLPNDGIYTFRDPSHYNYASLTMSESS